MEDDLELHVVLCKQNNEDFNLAVKNPYGSQYNSSLALGQACSMSGQSKFCFNMGGDLIRCTVSKPNLLEKHIVLTVMDNGIFLHLAPKISIMYLWMCGGGCLPSLLKDVSRF